MVAAIAPLAPSQPFLKSEINAETTVTPASTYKAGRRNLREFLIALVGNGSGSSTVRHAILETRTEQFDSFLIDRPQQLPATVADELVSGGTLPLMLDAMEYTTVTPEELQNLRSHTLDGDALMLLLDRSGEVVALFLQKHVTTEMVYVSAIVISPRSQGQGLLRRGCGVMLSVYQPRWLTLRTQQAVIGQYLSTIGQMHPMSGPVTAEAKRVAEQAQRHIDPLGNSAFDAERLVFPGLYTGELSDVTRVVKDLENDFGRDFFSRIDRKAGDCLMLVVELDSSKFPPSIFS